MRWNDGLVEPRRPTGTEEEIGLLLCGFGRQSLVIPRSSRCRGRAARGSLQSVGSPKPETELQRLPSFAPLNSLPVCCHSRIKLNGPPSVVGTGSIECRVGVTITASFCPQRCSRPPQCKTAPKQWPTGNAMSTAALAGGDAMAEVHNVRCTSVNERRPSI